MMNFNQTFLLRAKAKNNQGSLSDDIKFVEIFVDNTPKAIVIVYVSRTNGFFRQLVLDHAKLKAFGCRTIVDVYDFLERENISTEKFEIVNNFLSSESSVLFDSSSDFKLEERFNLADIRNSFCSYTPLGFEQLELFHDRKITISCLIENESGSKLQTNTLSLYGQFILLKNNDEVVVGGILVDEQCDALLFLERTDVVAGLLINSKFQKRITLGNIKNIIISDSNKTYEINIANELKKNESIDNKMIIYNI